MPRAAISDARPVHRGWMRTLEAHPQGHQHLAKRTECSRARGAIDSDRQGEERDRPGAVVALEQTVSIAAFPRARDPYSLALISFSISCSRTPREMHARVLCTLPGSRRSSILDRTSMWLFATRMLKETRVLGCGYVSGSADASTPFTLPQSACSGVTCIDCGAVDMRPEALSTVVI